MTESPKARLLLVEDSDTLAATYQAYLAKEQLHIERVASGEAAKQALAELRPQVMLLDLKLPDMDGMEVLRWMQSQAIPCSVIIITAFGSVDLAIDSLRQGVVDFLEKPFDAKRLKVTVANALKLQRLNDMVEQYQAQADRAEFHGFIGASLGMQNIYRMIEAVASSKATVFITGESGTGKEVCAEAIHQQGPRARQPFVALNCGAIPKDLMESEIFGHVKGAFTGASAMRLGAASQAHNGTLFLDEIGEMDMDLQTKLLRFIQTGRFQKVGSSQEEQVDVRFLCATNRDPWEEVQAGRFREDLYYRLFVVPIHLPPLRERGGDVLAIAETLLKRYAKEEKKRFRRFSALSAKAMGAHHWPGNVRELQNVIRNICVLHDGPEVRAEHLPPPVNLQVPPGASEPESSQDAASNSGDSSISNDLVASHPTAPAEIHHQLPGSEPAIPAQPLAAGEWQIPIQALAKTEREVIEHTINYCDGNIPKAAELLEVSPSTLYRKIQAWEAK